MTDAHLQQLLEKLREEIESTDVLDETTRGQLQRLDQEIHDLLEKPDEGDADTSKSLSRPVENFITELEESHPTLTMTLGRIMDILNKMGI